MRYPCLELRREPPSLPGHLGASSSGSGIHLNDPVQKTGTTSVLCLSHLIRDYAPIQDAYAVNSMGHIETVLVNVGNEVLTNPHQVNRVESEDEVMDWWRG